MVCAPSPSGSSSASTWEFPGWSRGSPASMCSSCCPATSSRRGSWRISRPTAGRGWPVSGGGGSCGCFPPPAGRARLLDAPAAALPARRHRHRCRLDRGLSRQLALHGGQQLLQRRRRAAHPAAHVVAGRRGTVLPGLAAGDHRGGAAGRGEAAARAPVAHRRPHRRVGPAPGLPVRPGRAGSRLHGHRLQGVRAAARRGAGDRAGRDAGPRAVRGAAPAHRGRRHRPGGRGAPTCGTGRGPCG